MPTAAIIALLLSLCSHIQPSLYISICSLFAYLRDHVHGDISCCRVFWKVLLESVFHASVIVHHETWRHGMCAVFNRFDTNTLITCFSADVECTNRMVSQSEHLQRVFCYERIYDGIALRGLTVVLPSQVVNTPESMKRLHLHATTHQSMPRCSTRHKARRLLTAVKRSCGQLVSTHSIATVLCGPYTRDHVQLRCPSVKLRFHGI